MPSPDVRYVAVLKVTRVTTTPATSYRTGGIEQPEKKETEHFQVPAIRATSLDRLREKVDQYMTLVTDEDFGDEPKVMRGRED